MTRKDRLKASARRARRLAKDKQAEQEQTQLEEVREEELELETPEPESVEKDYAEPMPMMAMGPTSFEELDEMQLAEEIAEQVREVTWSVQDLVRNILHDPMLEPAEKAQKIKAVAGDFEERVGMAMEDDLEKDIDVLEIQALLAMEDRSRGALRKGFDSVVDIAKRTLSGAARKKLADSDFALPEKRKYPIHDKAHVRNALARAAQQMHAGGEGAADAKAAMPKIRAAAKKFGIAMGMAKGLHIEKDKNGDWRWIGRPSNNFIDWQNDIMTQSAHQKYCDWLDANNDMAPLFLKWHTAGTQRENPVDFWMEHEGALIMSGKLSEAEAAELFRIQKKVDLGMSVQGIGLRLNPADRRQITDYWLYEVSDLPLEKAANPFTSLDLESITKEAGMDRLEYLTEMMGSKEKAEDFLKKTGQMQKNLQAAGLTSKEQEPPVAAAEPPAPPASEVAVKESDTDALIKRLKEEFDLDGLNEFVAQARENIEKVELLEAMVKALQKSDDERLGEQLTPPAMRYAWTRLNRPSQSDKTKIKKAGESEEDDELEKALPSAHWLSEVTNTAPIEAEV